MEVVKISLIAYVFFALGESGEIFAFYQRWLTRLPLWLAKPLGACYTCFIGQVCFWYYLIFKPFDVIEWLFFVSAGIFLSVIYNLIWNLKR